MLESLRRLLSAYLWTSARLQCLPLALSGYYSNQNSHCVPVRLLEILKLLSCLLSGSCTLCPVTKATSDLAPIRCRRDSCPGTCYPTRRFGSGRKQVSVVVQKCMRHSPRLLPSLQH
ncbi:hypothetical protein C8Q77DRAFT_1116579 [Trametes polyzona]|nr:hypothetical protein C8Q77DRAFT_1116579 [Trametes polyzona]